MRLRTKMIISSMIFLSCLYLLFTALNTKPYRPRNASGGGPRGPLAFKNPVDIKPRTIDLDGEEMEEKENGEKETQAVTWKKRNFAIQGEREGGTIEELRALKRKEVEEAERELQKEERDSDPYREETQQRRQQQGEDEEEKKEDDKGEGRHSSVATTTTVSSDDLQTSSPSLITKPKSKIAIITIYDNETPQPGPIGGRYLDILNMSLTNKKAYASKHGYDFHVDLHMWINKERPVAWSKLLAIRERLKEYEWVMWVDMDTLFMNFSIPLESLVDPAFDFIVTKDNSGLNSGVMLFHQSEWAINFLTECYAQDQFLIHKDIYEQRAIQHVVNTGSAVHSRHIKYLPQKKMNSYTHHHKAHYAYQPGDFMLHMAGCRFLPQCKPNFYETYKSYYELPKE